MTAGSNARDEQEKRALDALDKAVHDYMQARGETGDGVVLTNWGIVTACTKLVDNEPAFSTGSYQQPGGIPTYTWIGMLGVEHKRWINYFTQEDDGE